MNQQAQQTNGAYKGLERIIVIDAHVRGKSMVVQVDGHANLTGTNGAGKTTLLKLIPFFYGLTPAHLMPRIGGKLSFTEYMLPRFTSMLVFEYRNHLGLNCAVVFRHTSGAKPAYRFLRAGFDPEHFQEMLNGEKVFVEGRNLGRHWAGHELTCSVQLENVIDYRAVIQSDHELINRSTEHRDLERLAQVYSLSGNRSGMRHIDTVTHAILERNASVESIRTLLASIMRDNGLALPDNQLNRNLSEDVRNIRTLHKLEAEMVKFRAVIDAGTSYFENTKKITTVGEAVASILRKAESDQSNNKILIDEVEELIKVLKSNWDVRSQELQDAKTSAKSEKTQAERDIENLLDEKRGWEDQEIESKKFQLEQLPDYTRDLQEIVQRFNELTDGSNSIQTNYHERCSNEERLLADRVHKQEQKIADCKQRRSAAEGQYNVQLADLERRHSKESATLTEKYADQLGKLRGEHVIATNDSSQMRFTDEESTRIGLADQSVKTAQIDVRAATTIISSAELERDAARLQADDQLAAWQAATHNEKLIREEHTRFAEQVKPDPSTWLALLLRENPLWHDSIGRVVRRDVLLQKGLAPTRNTSTEDVFGWSINFPKIDKPDWATSFDETMTRLRVLDEKLGLAETETKKAERVSTLANASRDTAVRALDEARRKKGQAEKTQEAAERARDEIHHDCREEARARQEQSKLRAKDIARDIHDVSARRDNEIAQEKERHGEAKTEAFGCFSAEASEIESEIEVLNDSIVQHTKTYRERLKIYEIEFKAKLSKEGLDEKVINQAASALKEARNLVNTTEGYRTLVSDYSRWLDRHWSRHAEISRHLADTALAYQVAEAAYNDEQHNFNQQRVEKSLLLKEYAGKEKAFKHLIQTCQETFRLLDGNRWVNSTNNVFDGDITMLAAQVAQLVKDQKELLASIRDGIDRAESIICAGSDASRLRKAWEALRDDVKSRLIKPDDRNEQYLNMTVALNQLITVQLPQIRDGDLLAVRIAGHQLKAFYEALVVAKDLINQHARLISTEIGKGMQFEAIRDIRIELKNRIEDQDYWAELQAFVSNWEEWESNHANELLPDRLGDDLMSMSSVLARPKSHDSIETVFDLEISLIENGTAVTVKTSAEMKALASNGLAFLVLMAVYAGITRMLCSDQDVRIHWPVDELGVLAYENVNALFGLLDAHGIVIVSGFPSTERALLQHFKHNHGVKPHEGLVEINVPADRFERLTRQMKSRSNGDRVENMDGALP